MENKCKHEPDLMINNAMSLQSVANHLGDWMGSKQNSSLFRGKIMAAPILMALATEIALKALLCQEGKEPDRTHDLLKLFENLSEAAQTRLEEKHPCNLDLVSLRMRVQDFDPVGAGIRKVLEYHRDTFTSLRYLHEHPFQNCYQSELNKALTAIIETCEENHRIRSGVIQ